MTVIPTGASFDSPANYVKEPSRPISVLFFTPRLGTGGAEMHLLRLLNHFDRNLIKPTLAVVKPGGDYEGMLREDVSLHCLTAGRIKSSTISMISAVRPLRRLIDSLRPSVVVGVLEPAIAALHTSIRGMNDSTRPKLVACVQNNFTAESRDRKLGAKLFQPAITAGYRNADLTVAISQGVADDLASHIPTAADKLSVIYNAASDETIEERSRQRCPLQKPTDKTVLVSCGRFVKQKGYPFLLEAIDKVRRERPIELWMLGQGPDLSEIKDLANRSGLNDTIKFLGFQENPFCFFRQADLFVLSSLWEGFGNVLVEAMTCGTPVVSTDCPFGPAEIITHGKNGFLAPPGDSDALAAQIVAALSDTKRLQQMAIRGRQRAEDFRSQTIANQYAEAILGIL